MLKLAPFALISSEAKAGRSRAGTGLKHYVSAHHIHFLALFHLVALSSPSARQSGAVLTCSSSPSHCSSKAGWERQEEAVLPVSLALTCHRI